MAMPRDECALPRIAARLEKVSRAAHDGQSALAAILVTSSMARELSILDTAFITLGYSRRARLEGGDIYASNIY